MSSLTTRVARRLLALSVASLLACQAETRLAPDGPGTPPPDLARYAFYLDIDVANGSVRVVSPQPAPSRANGRLANSLAGSEIVGMTTSNFFRSAIGQFVANKRTITFDLTLSNKLSVTDLVTPTFPLPPTGVQGIIAFPYTVAAYGVSGGKATPDTSWNGTGATGSGAPVNFFNDFGVCGTATTSDCYRWEAFPTPLNPGQSTPAQKVGFTVDKKVTNVGVYVVVAADLVDHPPQPPQPGLGALSGVVTSASLGPLGGVSVGLAPGGQSAVTDGVGRYLFTGLPVGPFTVTASGLPSGCTTPASVGGTIVSGGLATANFDVTCQPTTGTISGMATSPELGALASATVQLLQAGATTPVSQTTTNAAGAFTFSGVAPGSYVVQLVGLAPPCPATPGSVAVTVTAGNTSTPTFSVPCVGTGNGTISGTVTSPQLGHPSIQLSLRSNGGGSAVLVSSDPVTGSYGPITIAAGQVTVIVNFVQSNCTPPIAQTVSVAAGVSVTVNFSVFCGGAGTTGQIIGMASSPELGPLTSATVQLLQAGTLTPVVETATYAAGNFLFGGIAPGSYLIQLVGLQPPCPATAGPVAVTVTAGNPSTATVSVSCVDNSAPVLTGIVTSSPGGPLGGVTVTATSLAGSFTALTDASGAFSFDNRILLLTGLPTSVSLAITAGLPAGCTAPTTPTTVLVSAGTLASAAFDVNCQPTGAISGTATSPELGPFGSATVQLLPGPGLPPIAQTTTNGSGAFSFSGVAPGDYQVQIIGLTPPCPATSAPVSVTVTAGTASTANISVSCPVTTTTIITGTVSSSSLGTLNGVTVTATVPGPGTTHLTQTSGAGDFSFDSTILPPGMGFANVILTLTAGLPPGCSTPLAVLVTVDASAAAPVAVPIAVTCTPPATTGSISGTVTWLGGGLSEPLSITVAGGPPTTVVPDPISGAYGPVSVAPGQATVALAAVPAGCTDPGAQTVSVAAGATVTVDFGVVCPNSNIIGRIISPTLGALGGVTIAVTINGVDNGSLLSDAGGNFAGLFFWTGNSSATVDLTVTGGLPQSCTSGGLSLTVAKGSTAFGHISVAC